VGLYNTVSTLVTILYLLVHYLGLHYKDRCHNTLLIQCLPAFVYVCQQCLSEPLVSRRKPKTMCTTLKY